MSDSESGYSSDYSSSCCCCQAIRARTKPTAFIDASGRNLLIDDEDDEDDEQQSLPEHPRWQSPQLSKQTQLRQQQYEERREQQQQQQPTPAATPTPPPVRSPSTTELKLNAVAIAAASIGGRTIAPRPIQSIPTANQQQQQQKPVPSLLSRDYVLPARPKPGRKPKTDKDASSSASSPSSSASEGGKVFKQDPKRRKQNCEAQRRWRAAKKAAEREARERERGRGGMGSRGVGMIVV